MRDNHSQGTDPLSAVILSDGGPRLDEFFDALADYRRRYALYYLREEERASLTDTARQIAAWERECPSKDVSDEMVERLKVNLYHTHLPKLREAKILEYDQRSAMLVYRDPPEIIGACLDLSTQRDFPGSPPNPGLE